MPEMLIVVKILHQCYAQPQEICGTHASNEKGSLMNKIFYLVATFAFCVLTICCVTTLEMVHQKNLLLLPENHAKIEALMRHQDVLPRRTLFKFANGRYAMTDEDYRGDYTIRLATDIGCLYTYNATDVEDAGAEIVAPDNQGALRAWIYQESGPVNKFLDKK